MKVQIFDPPMCCSTGICGPGVDPALVEFNADLDWLKRQGIEVERFNLSQQTQAFVSHEAVSNALKTDGNECLPLILVNGEIVVKGAYPKRDKLAELTGLDLSEVPVKSAPRLTVEQPAQSSGCCSPASSTSEHESCCAEESEMKSEKKSE